MTKQRTATRLRRLQVHEVSLVPSPASVGANILITKEGEGGAFKPCADCPDPKMCGAKSRCATETPAKNTGRGYRGMVRKGLEAADAALALIEKDQDATGDLHPSVAIAEDALLEGIEKAAATFAELIGTVEQVEKLRRGVSALNQAVWAVMDDREAQADAPRLIAKSVVQFHEWIAKTFDVAKGGDDEPDAGGPGKPGGAPANPPANPKDPKMTDVAKERDEAVAKAAALEKQMTDQAARIAKMEERMAEVAIEKAAEEVAAAAPGLAIDKAKLRELVTGLDDNGRDALVSVLKAAAAQAGASSLFTVIGKAGEAAAQPGTDIAKEGQASMRKRMQGLADDMKRRAAC